MFLFFLVVEVFCGNLVLIGEVRIYVLEYCMVRYCFKLEDKFIWFFFIFLVEGSVNGYYGRVKGFEVIF